MDLEFCDAPDRRPAMIRTLFDAGR